MNVVLILSPHIPGLGTDAGMGASRGSSWASQVQPGEFAKITVILLDASVMARYGGRLDDAREYLKALGIMLVPFACIMTQPDLGTGLVYLFIGAVALVVGGARPKYLLVTLAAGIVAVAWPCSRSTRCCPYATPTARCEYKLLKNYQRDRLLVFLDPDMRPDGRRLQPASRRRSPSGRAACSARASSRARSMRWAYCPRRPPTSSSACWPRNSGFSV